MKTNLTQTTERRPMKAGILKIDNETEIALGKNGE